MNLQPLKLLIFGEICVQRLVIEIANSFMLL
jgi:hypothetical protein